MIANGAGGRFILDFAEPGCRDVRQVGGKAAGLADMTEAGLPVSPGFAVNATAYRAYLATGSTSIPVAVAEEIRTGYARLCAEVGVPDVSVAVRSSATAEDSVDASFAGEFETWVDVVGIEDVLRHVELCYRSVYADRVLSYLEAKAIAPDAIEMAVVIQKTVRARAAGVMFTLSPTSGDRSKIAIEASWGLGLAVVGGEVTPDRFLVNKIGLEIVERALGSKEIEYRRGDATQPVPDHRREIACLTDDELTALARLGKQLEQLHGAPQDIEFALDEELPTGRNVILLQCRPETVWAGVQRQPAFDATAGMMSWITGSISGAPSVGARDATTSGVTVGHHHGTGDD